MWKKNIPSIIWFLCLCATFTTAIQIDNRLVSAQNDCFERIALGAMMPFDSTFRNTDTNLLRTCEELCAREGTKCQTFAFGIHPRGNGTCQLSSQRIDASKSRPVGTIFDPDFDMYARKENCLPQQGTTSQLPFPGNFPGGTDRPAQFPPSSTSARPGGPPFTSVDSTANTRPPSTPIYTTTDTTGSSLPTTGSTGETTYGTQTTNRYPETPFPPTEGYPNRPPNKPSYGGTNGRPYGPEFPSSPGRYPGQRPIDPATDSNGGHSGYYPAVSQRPSNPNPQHFKIKPLWDKYRPRPTNVPGDRETGYGSAGQPAAGGGGGSGSGGYQVTELPTGSDNRPSDPYGNPTNTYVKPVTNDKYKPPSGGGAYGPSGGSGYRPRPETPCFRRVLAGKRVASHWVRRTLSCERVEDCQRECGEEKRFICEGFNYRLDPSGRGQGNCELTEVPLGEMDLYSSPFHRDKNLINHPDYDYYERDRSNSPSCRMPPTGCINCGLKPYRPPPPPPSYGGGPTDFYRPTTFRPQIDSYPGFSPDRYKPETGSGYGGHFRPPTSDYNRYDVSTAVDIYRPPPNYQSSSKPYGVDRYDQFRPSRPDRPPSDYYDHDRPNYGRPPPESFYQPRPDSYRPRPSLNKPRPSYGGGSYDGDIYRERYPPPRPGYNYLDRDDKPTGGSYKPQSNFVPYQIGQSTYGGGYSSSSSSGAYWGIQQQYETKRPESGQFNYFELGGNQKYSHPEENSIWGYPGSRYGPEDRPNRPPDRPNRVDYGTQWTRRPGADECSVKSSEGFRLHKGVVRHAYAVPNVRECEKMCVGEDKFKCYTYSYRYSGGARDNCFLCDRPYNLLDYYADLEPDRDCDIYSMSDDMKSCTQQPAREEQSNAQCFFKAIDSNRFFKSIVRDSLTVKSIGECEWECIKSNKFTCRSFTFRYRAHGHDSVIDNCQLSDWPCKDIDKDRHLVADPSFDIYERASYGHGCELQPIVDEKHQKLCYLGYGSPAKLLSSAIKKVISAPTELECKNECVRFRETTPFKCYSFSYGSQASSYNCEMSDLDQSELKVNVHYTHTTDRDFWLFAWNPFDFTCRDKVTSVSGNRNDRRMDVFREPGEEPWRHFTVSGKPCRQGAKCEQNVVTGFYSCEIDGGEIGSWDYCCKDDHPCGYSQGFDYPWCYVGDKLDQWRTCSDRYFPGKPSTSQVHPTKKKGEIYQQPPRPGGLQSLEEFSAARLWPITFLYNEGPPNSTELSNVVDCKKEDC